MKRFVALVFLLAAACGESPQGSSLDSGLPAPDAMALSDASPQVDGSPDAATGIECARHSLGVAGYADIAYADGFFAVARYGLGFEFMVTQYEDDGTALTTFSTPGLLFARPPALAGRETFLIAYDSPPEGGLGLMPLTPGGEVGATTSVPTTGSLLHIALDASAVSPEFGLVYQDEEGVKFVRAAADGSIVSGPSIVGLEPLIGLRGFTYREGGWAVVTRQDAEVRVHLLDNDGAIQSAYALPDYTVVGGVTSAGADVSVLGWDATQSLTLHQTDSMTPLGTAYYPGGLSIDSGGITAGYVDSALDFHVVHATLAGTINSDQVLGSQLSSIPVVPPKVAVSESGTRAAVWVKDLDGDSAPELFFGLACQP